MSMDAVMFTFRRSDNITKHLCKFARPALCVFLLTHLTLTFRSICLPLKLLRFSSYWRRHQENSLDFLLRLVENRWRETGKRTRARRCSSRSRWTIGKRRRRDRTVPTRFHRRYRLWIDEVSQLFGGLDICAIEIVQSKDGKEFIVQVRSIDRFLFPFESLFFFLRLLRSTIVVCNS